MESKTLSNKRVREIVMANGGRRYLVLGGLTWPEIKNSGEEEVWVWHEKPITVECLGGTDEQAGNARTPRTR